MKTVIIYEQGFEYPISFYVVDGNYSHLNGVYGNCMAFDKSVQTELFKLVFNDDWSHKPSLSEFPTQAVVDGAIVIVCGFYY